MTAQIICLADYRKDEDTAPSELPFGWIAEVADEAFAMQVALTALATETLATAAQMATKPLFPNGIDNIEF